MKADRHDEIMATMLTKPDPVTSLDEMIQGKLHTRDLTWFFILCLFCSIFVGIVCLKEEKHASEKFIIEAQMKYYDMDVRAWKDSVLETKTLKWLK